MGIYILSQICYNERMSIGSFLKNWLYRRRLKKYGLQFPIYCKAHGVKHLDRQGAIAQSRTGDRLQLVHGPLPDYPHNVYVYSISLNRILGYLDETLSIKLVFVFGKGFCRDGIIEAITGGEPYQYFGCNVKLLDTREFCKDETDFSALRGE